MLDVKVALSLPGFGGHSDWVNELCYGFVCLDPREIYSKGLDGVTMGQIFQTELFHVTIESLT